ncbi:MAG: glycosyltransferase family 4 protein [Bacteroidales bacterium]
MKIAFIGTYPPRKCGIGVFTHNLVKAIVGNTENQKISLKAMVVAMNDTPNSYTYPEEVKKIIQENNLPDYINAAKFINYSDAKVCILEHEFGIFGGNDGAYILPLLHRLEIPIIVTFHTILKDPSSTQKSVIQEIGKEVARIVVMSKQAVTFLIDIYNIPKEKIVLIEHGVPDYKHITREKAKEKHGLSNLKILFTFGLLSRNKGIETVIKALPRVVEKYPDLLYIVLGATHPNVLKYSGDEYRYELQRMVKSHGLEKNVYFNNEFATEDELMEYLQTCDIYISPYLNEAQITSGTLSYAIGAGCAVLSTPYWHAQELLDNNRGRLFNFKDSEQLADLLLELFDNPEQLNIIRKNALDYGKKIRWSKTGKQYLNLAEYVHKNWGKKDKSNKQSIDIQLIPPFSLEHIIRLTDDTGIVQYAKYGIPNLKKGYCVDDNSRALLMVVMAYRQNKNRETLKLIPIYLSFIDYMQQENGDFRNFLSFNRQFLDEYGSEDSFGRTIWALGYLLRFPPNDSFKQMGKGILLKSVPHFSSLKTIRGAANTIIGIYNYLKDSPNDEGIIHEMNKLVKIITQAYKKQATEDWKWFEPIMTYDNAIIPLSLFSAYEVIEDNEILQIAKESTIFLESKTIKHGYFIPIGNNGWLKKGGKIPEYDQQSIDVLAMILLYYQLFYITKEQIYMDKMFNCYLWFHGKNSLRLPLYDHETKGCCDGLDKQGINRNQGAESTLSYWISHLIVLSAQGEKI